MKRVLVIGSGVAGKTTLALEVGMITALPVVHLDRLHWGRNWAIPDRDTWHRRLKDAIAEDAWILDGNYSGSLPLRLPQADTVLFLDLPPHICVWRAIRRSQHYRSMTRPDMAPGCEEKLTLSFLYWTWTFRRRKVPVMTKMIRDHAPHADVVVMKSQSDVERYLASLRTHRGVERSSVYTL